MRLPFSKLGESMTVEERRKLILKGELPEGVRKNNTFKMVTALLSYLGCIGVTLAVMKYIDGTAGVILTAALICAFVLSTLLTLLISFFINVEITIDKPAANKKDKVTMTVRLSKRILLPSPPIEIFAGSTPQLVPRDGLLFKAAVAGREVNNVDIAFDAKYSGAAALYVSEVRLTDYLGIFSFRLKKAALEVQTVAVYPDIPDAAVQTDFLKTTSMILNNDDEEEEADEVSMIPTGLAGYEHRVYIPGDPIKRINWKLSSKRDEYMVRLDEQIVGSGQLFFLDAPDIENTELSLSVRDNVIEGALAVFTMLIREGREASFYFPKDGLWYCIDIRSIGDVYQIQELLGDFKPDKNVTLIPEDIVLSGKVAICFTAAVAEQSSSVIRITSALPEVMVINAADSGLGDICPNMWSISKEFELKKQK